MGISQQTFYRWRRKFAGMGVAERRLKQLEKEKSASSDWLPTSVLTSICCRR